MNDFLPFALPDIGEEEISEVVDSLRSGWLTTGPKTRLFEQELADYVGVRHALAVNSGTAGLHLALEATGIGPGDKVLTTPYTFTATAEVIRYLGADPVFIDIDPHTFNIDVQKLDDYLRSPSARQSMSKAIIPVHFAGQSCDMEPIVALARDYNLKVIEDAAHALPTTYKGRMIGTIGDLTVYSFYATKPVATGEGGMVVTENASYAERVRTMRLHGISRDIFDRNSCDSPSWYYEVVAPGFKYNMTDVAAAIGIHQLRRAESLRLRREQIARTYSEAFSDLPLRTPYVARTEDKHAWHLYVIQLEVESLKVSRDRFIEKMYEEKIGTSVHFIPLHLHPYWRDRYGFQPEDFPVSLDVYKRVVSLPIYTRMSDDDVQRVVDAVRRIMTE